MGRMSKPKAFEGVKFNDMTPPEFYNYHIQNCGCIGEPIEHKDVIDPPEDLDRETMTWRQMCKYGCFHRPGYPLPLTEDEYVAEEKKREANERANTIAERNRAKAEDKEAGEQLKEKAETESLRTQGGDYEL